MRSEFLAVVNQNAVRPVDVFNCEIRCVRLSGAGLVQKFIVRAAFRIFFRSDDCCMFFGSDRSFTSASNFGPCSFGEDGPRKPAEINGQVVESANIMSNAVSIRMDDRENFFAGCLHERFYFELRRRLCCGTHGRSDPALMGFRGLPFR